MACIATGLLAACEKPNEVRSVQWYTENRDQIMPTLERCKRMNADRNADPNCLNASRAMLVPAPNKK